MPIKHITPALSIGKIGVAPLLACLCLAASSLAWGDATRQPWRFTHALAAPWGPAVPGTPDLTGRTLILGPNSMRGPHPLDCSHAQVQQLQLPAEGLFQGNLPSPARDAAQALGIAPGMVPSIRVTCANGSFDFHQADPDTLLLGLDNRVWNLTRSPGAAMAQDTPEGVVQRLLEAHFRGDMGFSPTSVKAKAAYLSPALARDLARYFARARPADEVPPINGDPFTNSQEYPTRFAVGRAGREGKAARLPVRFADGWRQYTLQYRLTAVPGQGWRVDDVRGEGMESLRKALNGTP